MTTDVQLYSTSANFDYQRTQKQQPQLSQFELRRKNNILRVLSNLKMSKATNNSEIYAAIEELRRENERVVAELSSTQDLLDLFERYRVLIREHMDFCVCAGKDHQMTKWRKYEQEYRQLVPIRSTMVTPPNVCLPKKAVMGANRSLNPFINDNISHSNQHSQSSSPVSELSTSTNNTSAKVQKGTIVIGPTGGASIKYSNTSGTNSSHPLIQLESKQSSLNGHLARHSHQSKHQNDLELQVVDPGKSLIRSFLDSSNSKTTTTTTSTSSSPSSNRNIITNSQGNTIVIRKRTIPELIQSNQDGTTQHKMVVIANKKAKLGNLQSNNNAINNYSNLKNILTMNKANVSQVSNEEEQSVEHLDQLNNALDQLLMGRYDALNKIQSQLRNNNNRLNQAQRFSGGNNQDGEDEEDDDDDGEESSSNDNGELGTQDFEESGMVDGFTQEMFDTIRGAVGGTGAGADDDGDDEDDDEDDGDIIFLDEVKSNEQRQQTQHAQHGQSKANTILSAALESGYKPYPTYHRIVTNVTNSLNADDSGSNILMDSQQQQPSSKPMLIQKRPHLTSEERSDIIGRLKKNESGARIARDYGITKQAVSAIKRRAQLMGDNFQPINPSYYVALKNNTFAPLSSQLANNPNVQKAATITETSNGQFVAQRAIAKSPQQPQPSSKPSSMTMSLSSSSGDNSLVARQLKQQKLNDTIIKQSNLLAGLPRATSDLVLPVNPVAIIKSQMAKQRQQSDPNSPSSGSSPKIDHKRLLLPRLLQGTESYPPTSYQSGGSGKIIVNPASITGTSIASTSSPLKTLLTKSIEPSKTSSSSTNFLGVISNSSPAAESINIKQEQLDEEIIKPVSNNNQEEASEEEEFDLNANDNANPGLMEFDGTIVGQRIREQGQKNKVQVKAEEEEEEEEENEIEDAEEQVAGTVPGETAADDSNLDQDFDNNNNDMINFDDIDYIDNNDTAKPEAGESEEDSESEEGEEAADETQQMEPEAEIEEDGADEPQQEEQEESQDNPEEESDANEEQEEGEEDQEEQDDMDQTAEEPQDEQQQEEEKDNSNSMVQADTNSD